MELLHICSAAIVLLFVVLPVAEQQIQQVQLASSGSRIERLQKAGKYQEYLQQFDSTRSNGSQSITDWFDITYTMRIWLGTPAKFFDVALESISAGLWVADSGCSACNGPPGYIKKKYNRSASTTGTQFSSFNWQQYDAYIQGPGVLDILMIANMNVTDQPFVSVTSISNGQFFSQMPADGVLGLAWPSLSIDDALTPVMQMLMPQLDVPIFTVFLERNEGAEGTPNGGLMTFGSLDPRNCNGTLTYAPLTSTTYWQFGMDGVSIGNYTQNAFTQAMVAVDYSFIGGPQNIVDAMMREIGARYNSSYQQYQIPCSRVPTLPNLRFMINAQNHTLPSDYYMRQTDIGDGNCTVALAAYTSGGFGPRWVFGQTFLHVYCAVHDVGQSRIGFARVSKVGNRNSA